MAVRKDLCALCVSVANKKFMKNQHTSIGKIARLPKFIRKKLNCRLEDGQPASEILPWLNALPRVQKILAAQFAGAPVIKQNLSNWRVTGFRRWQKKQQPIASLAELGEDATDLMNAAGGRLARGAAAIAAGQILKFLKTIPPNKRSPRDALKVAAAVASLVKADQNHVRLKLAKRKVRQKEAQILLMRDKHQRDVVAIGLRLLKDERARLIQSGPFNHAAKIELLGRHIFGHLWQPRLLPQAAPKCNVGGPPTASEHSEDGSSSLPVSPPLSNVKSQICNR